MTCQNCGQRPASVHLTQRINGRVSTIDLCAQCAAQAQRHSLEQLLENLFGSRARGGENVLERLSPEAREVLNSAADQTVEWGFEQLGVEFLMLGLLQEARWGEALQADLKLSRAQIESEVQRFLGRGEPLRTQEVVLSPRVKKVLEIAHHETIALQHPAIGPEHLLLGIALEGESLAAHMLSAAGFDAERLREWLNQQALRAGASGQAPGGEAAPAQAGAGKRLPPHLSQYARDLTGLAEAGKLDPIVGREAEIDRVIRILSRKTKNNPVLIGEPGVGKTAIAEGLAQRILSGDVPELLLGKRVLSLDLAGMIAGAKFRGEFEERLKGVIDEVRSLAGQVVLFIDELHTVVGAGASEGAMDAANMLKPSLARGELQVVGATTLDEYRKHIEKDAALERRFQPVLVSEPSPEAALEILRGLRDSYEAHHRVAISDAALAAAVELSDKYVSDRFLPDKAIDLLDEACAMQRLGSRTASDAWKRLEGELARLEREKAAAVANERYVDAAELKTRIDATRSELETVKRDWQGSKGTSAPVVGPEEIARVVSEWTGIPANKLVQEEVERLLEMEQHLHARVIGQDEAVKAVAEAVRRARSGLKDPKRPIGSFIFLGPTGVGKTELAKALAEHLFNDESAMLRFDMSEYMEKHTVSRLVGAPPGYVGYDEAGQLTEAVRRKPYSVILFDEIEKAHPDVFNMLLQILDDGRLTDAQGRTVDFKNTIVIMTSNVGAQHLVRAGGGIGFHASAEEAAAHDWAHMKETALDALKQAFRPEFLNRVDETIVFHPLEPKHILSIVELMLEGLRRKLHAQNIGLTLTDEAKQTLATQGYDAHFGARPIKRAIQRRLETPLSDLLLKGEFGAGDQVRVDVADGQFTFFKAEPAVQPAPQS